MARDGSGYRGLGAAWGIARGQNMASRYDSCCYAMRDTDWVEAIQWHRNSKESFNKIQDFLGDGFSMHVDEDGWLFITKRHEGTVIEKTVCHHVPPEWVILKTRGNHLIVCTVEALEDTFYATGC